MIFPVAIEVMFTNLAIISYPQCVVQSCYPLVIFHVAMENCVEHGPNFSSMINMMMIFHSYQMIPDEQGSKDAMKGFNYDRSSLLKICDLLCVAIGGLM